MRVWFDAPGMRELLFLEGMAERAGRRHEVLLTVPCGPGALAAARARGIDAMAAGGGRRGAGSGPHMALESRIGRIRSLSRAVPRFGPDLAVSLCSPEAARVAYGLGINHVAFGGGQGGGIGGEGEDSCEPRRTAPLAQKMIVPWLEPAAPYLRRGLAAADLVRFRGTIESVTARRKRPPLPRPGRAAGRAEEKMIRPGSVLVRPPAGGNGRADPIRWAAGVAGAAAGAAGDGGAVAVVLARRGQARALRAALGRRARVVDADGRIDGMLLLSRCGALVGQGGSAMVAEAALSGAPAVSYGGRPGAAEKHLGRRGLVARASSAGGVRALVGRLLGGGSGGKKAARAARSALKAKARAEMSLMEDPYPVLAGAARALGRRL